MDVVRKQVARINHATNGAQCFLTLQDLALQTIDFILEQVEPLAPVASENGADRGNADPEGA